MKYIYQNSNLRIPIFTHRMRTLATVYIYYAATDFAVPHLKFNLYILVVMIVPTKICRGTRYLYYLALLHTIIGYF